jgi:hypothetical protein
MSALDRTPSSLSNAQQNHEAPVSRIELRNGHCREMPATFLDPVLDAPLEMDASMFMAQVQKESTGIIYGIPDSSTAKKIGDDVVWLAQKAYGREPLVVECYPNGVSEESAKEIIGIIGNFLTRRKFERVLIIQGIDNLVSERGEDATRVHNEVDSAIRKILAGSDGSQHIVATSQSPALSIQSAFSANRGAYQVDHENDLGENSEQSSVLATV